MKVRLMFKDKDFKPGIYTLFGKEMVAADLETNRIITAMGRNDDTIRNIAETAIFSPLTDLNEILYRQNAVSDARNNSSAVRDLYGFINNALNNQARSFHAFSTSTNMRSNIASEYRNSLNFLSVYIGLLHTLRASADKNHKNFKSEAFVNFFEMIRTDMDDKYFKLIKEKMSELADAADGEILVSASLGHFLQGVDYVFRKIDKSARRSARLAPGYTIPERDAQTGLADIDNRKARAYTEVANTLVKATKRMQSFFTQLRDELGFYIGCLNLDEEMSAMGLQTCVPKFLPMESRKRKWSKLYDVSLALTKKTKIVTGDYDGEGYNLYLITGANQGGKSTFLRGIGQAQLMAQAGMPVGAEECTIPIRSGLFTHFRREEDSRMKSGKLDEELSRLEKVLDFIRPGYTIMFNESFASTNEREGGEILRQITDAFLENGLEIYSVTHLLSYAGGYYNTPKTQYLKAERLPSGERTFKIIPELPDVTAFGEDLYQKIFG